MGVYVWILRVHFYIFFVTGLTVTALTSIPILSGNESPIVTLIEVFS